MQPSSKKFKKLALLVSMMFCALFLVHAAIINALGNRSTPISSSSLAVLKLVLIFMSLYGFAVAWFFQFRWVTILNRRSQNPRRLSPEVSLVLISYPLLVSPALYGLLLYVCGMPFREFFYFIGTTIAMTLAWGIYDLRKK